MCAVTIRNFIKSKNRFIVKNLEHRQILAFTNNGYSFLQELVIWVGNPLSTISF